jgi:hypothetical protein
VQYAHCVVSRASILSGRRPAFTRAATGNPFGYGGCARGPGNFTTLPTLFREHGCVRHKSCLLLHLFVFRVVFVLNEPNEAPTPSSPRWAVSGVACAGQLRCVSLSRSCWRLGNVARGRSCCITLWCFHNGDRATVHPTCNRTRPCRRDGSAHIPTRTCVRIWQ